MKRRDLLKATGAAVVTLALRAVAQDSQGVVKVNLYDVTDDTVVGWVALNTNPSGKLFVTVHLEQGDDLTMFDVCVTVNGVEHEAYMGELITNSEGKGSAHLTLPIAEYSDDEESDVLEVVVEFGGWEWVLIDE